MIQPPNEPPTTGTRAALDRLRRFGGDTLLREMIDLFLLHTPKRIHAARLAAGTGDRAGTRLVAHGMISSCGQLGAERLRELSVRAEQLASSDLAGAAAALEMMEREFADVRAWLLAERPPSE